MTTFRRLGKFWLPWLATIVVICFSNAIAQARYKVVDLGTEKNHSFSMVMSVNNQGWTYIMDGNLQNPDNLGATLLNGRVLIDVGGFKIDLGTLGGHNSWMNWGQINDLAQVVGYSETKVPDPNGEDICGFGTHLTCRPFLWEFPPMRALPTLGGNNGEASSINNRGQIVGMAEDGTVDSTCSPGKTNNRTQLPVLWERGEHGKFHPTRLPTVDGDPDGFAFWINNKGQAVGQSNNCNQTITHAVSWKNETASALADYGLGASAQGINDQGQIVGFVGTPDGTLHGAFWQNENDTLTVLGFLPGDMWSLAFGVNSKGQVVGGTVDSNFNWSHAFIWQNDVMTDLNTLFLPGSNLRATFAGKINERGQIGGMAIVLSGPDKDNVHAFLAIPVRESTDE